MNQQTIARLYDDYTDAEATIRDLEVHGIAHDDISLIANNADDRHVVHTESGNESGTGAEIGAGLGAVAGGGAGVLAGLGMLAIPGVGPVVAAGWLVALAVGAVGGAIAGGMVGGLVGAGINKEHAETYAEGVRRGGNLVTVRWCPPNMQPRSRRSWMVMVPSIRPRVAPSMPAKVGPAMIRMLRSTHRRTSGIRRPFWIAEGMRWWCSG